MKLFDYAEDLGQDDATTAGWSVKTTVTGRASITRASSGGRLYITFHFPDDQEADNDQDFGG